MNTTSRSAIEIVFFSMLAICPTLAQNSDFGLLYGFRPCGDCPSSTVASGSQFNYGHQVVATLAGDLYVEIPLVSSTNPVGNVAYLFTPGLRYKLATQSRLSLYGALGVGVASFGGTATASRTTSGTVDFAGGADLRLTRLLSVRLEARDFVTRPGLGGTEGRNHAMYFVGIAFHF
jgi:hypothetical protein